MLINAPGSPKQKGIVTYAVSTNRQKPLAGTVNAAVFNTFRRTKSQILYWGVPILFAYSALEWADRRNHFLNSKAGRMHDAETEKE
ncbi:hypothetical protein M436DRAFT_57449 [Aureobasidium namibiae CBS 147.97]|uniref:Cytochrome b-c1 complex subunit 8 n=1 Tax=Aureobasidium namibiae CBS 147.97 TaxID=1043004 RepID=A0A074W7G5_9PEZI|nr:uncharacterized protein M436DRAFT_57449 [Aureobasidium namibiae CBS 147.97]KEQ68808.1 hypothetical protein M436DRAFT_57449 [Aureobasidium namibiae CBS 147.97]